jgi:hypothetical protein
MNKEQAIEQFVRENYKLLLNKMLSQQKFKQSFNERYGKQFHKVDPKEVVVSLVTFLKKSGVPGENIRKYIDTLPIFRSISSNVENQLYRIADGKDQAVGLDPEDVDIIKRFDAVEAVKRLHVKEIEIEANKELEDYYKRIQELREEYDSLPSVLDQEDIPEPPFDPQFEETQQWWERFYLKTNPFPFGADGLAKIDESLYEEILVKTTPFQDILSALKKDPDCLFHTGFLLVGDYGYGKTTFIDYLNYYLIQKNILPIRITPSKSFPDSSGYEDDFHINLRDKLQDELLKISNESISDLKDLGIVGQIKQLIRHVQSHRRDGIVIFLDDYHKRQSGFKDVYEFLGLQQILKNNLTRAGLNVGFIVSGTPEWHRHLSNDGQMRGFLDNRPIVLPIITPELVCEVFNQRIKAYCFDESPRRIRAEFVKRMFKVVEGHAGFRDYLTEIISQLSNNNLSIIDTPMEIDSLTLANIRSSLERDESLRNSFQKLTQSSKFQSYTKEQIAKCLVLLIQTSIHDGLTENDKLFEENKYYFKLLDEASLIQKRKRTVADDMNSFEWVIHSRLQKAIDLIKDRYRLSINDYLLKLYAWKGYSSQPVETEDQPSEISEFKRFFSREDLNIPKAASDNIQLALRLFDANLLAKSSVKPTAGQINHGWDAFSYLSDAFFEIDGSKKFFHDAGISELKDCWRFHWFDDEVLSELLYRFNDYNSSASEKNNSGSLVWKQLKEVFPILAERLKDITEDISNETFGGLFTRNVQHTKSELLVFDQVREGYSSAINLDHYKYVKDVTDHLEIRFRLFLYATSVLVFGGKYVSKMPESLHKYSSKNLESRPSSTLFNNAYSGLTRGQLRVIFAQGNPIKNFICKYIDCGWKSDDWENFFDAFVVENIAAAHQGMDRFSHLDKARYLQYCRRAEELMCAINILVRNIIRNSSYLILCGDDTNDPTNYLFKFVFKPSDQQRGEVRGKVFTPDAMPKFLQDDNAEEGMLDGGIYDRVIKLLEHKIEGSSRNCLVEDLLEVEYIVNNYNVSYPDFIQSLVFAYYVDKKIVLQPWFGSSILLKRSAPGQSTR